MPKGGARNKVPTQLKVLKGTDRPDRLLNEPKPNPVAPAKAPFPLDAGGRRTWRLLAPALERLGVLTEVDGHLFGAFCAAMSRYVGAQRRLRALLKQEPPAAAGAVRVAEISVEKSETSVRLLGGEFGLSPASRSRIDLPAAKDDDELEALLHGGEAAGGGNRRSRR